MSDFDTRRVGEIHALEERINALQTELKVMKAAAHKWEPKVHGSMDAKSETAKITMHFGGKAFAAEMPMTLLKTGTLTGITTSVIETLCVHLVAQQLKQAVEPEIQKLMTGVSLTQEAGKW